MARELTRLRFAGGEQGFNWLPVLVAENQGLFEKNGLKIEYLWLGSLDKAASAVSDGDADLAITYPEAVISDYVSGGDLRIIGANSLCLSMSMVARPEIGSLAELRGKRIGTSSLTAGTAIYVQMMLQQEGLSYPADYDFVLSGLHTARWQALRNGEIDCAPQPAPWNFLAEREGYRLIGEVNDVIGEIVFAAIVGNRKWLSQHGETAGKLIASLAQAHDFVNDPANDAITLPIYQSITVADDPDLAAKALSYTRDMRLWPKDLRVSLAASQTTTDLMIRAGLLDEKYRAEAAGAFDESFVAAG
jgi:ABC-type nitrate/sulfonate/bicarbonate transport system substrate-binding protein